MGVDNYSEISSHLFLLFRLTSDFSIKIFIRFFTIKYSKKALIVGSLANDEEERSSRDILQRITKTRLYNVDPLKPHFYIVKLGFKGVYNIILISAQKHRL